MKRFIKYILAVVMVGGSLVSCSDWTESEREITQHPHQQSPILRDNAYYQALREYKKTKHKIAFGWYGSWTAVGASYQTRLVSAPDSMDIISIWSQWHSLTPEQMADKEFVQKIKGTKVTYTIFSDKMPEPFLTEIGGGEYTDEAIEAYAKAYCKDSMDKYNYDGIDIDYEPGYGANGPFVGHDNELFTKLILAMSKYVGPKSGTGRLLMIDGVPFAASREVTECFDYGIVQAYASSGYTDLQRRFDNAAAKGWKPEQYIFAENFESYWKTGGVNHKCQDGTVVGSLLGMARFNPEQGFGAGFGAYHMEYEYANTSMPYKYMREAIQDMNPAGGSIVVALSPASVVKHALVLNSDGSVDGSIDDRICLKFSRPVSFEASFALSVDNSLVGKFNLKNGTDYDEYDASKVSLKEITVREGMLRSDEVPVEVDLRGITSGEFLIPVVVDSPENMNLVVREPLVHYLLISVKGMDINVGATALTGEKIAPTPAWTVDFYRGQNSSGDPGILNISDEKKAWMFDGSIDDFKYLDSSSRAWGRNGGNFIIGMDKIYDVSGFRWHMPSSVSDAEPDCIEFVYSTDGEEWVSLTNGVRFKPTVDNARWKIFQFTKSVKAKYLRVFVAPHSTSKRVSMDEFEVYAPSK